MLLHTLARIIHFIHLIEERESWQRGSETHRQQSVPIGRTIEGSYIERKLSRAQIDWTRMRPERGHRFLHRPELPS